MKILSTSQIRQADKFTMINEPILSIDLMERASHAFTTKFLALFPRRRPLKVFCGIGNNGGDGLAIGRMLASKGWEVNYYIVGKVEKGSEDFRTTLDLISKYCVLTTKEDFPKIDTGDIIVDGLFGSGLSRPTEGIASDLISYLNRHEGISKN